MNISDETVAKFPKLSKWNLAGELLEEYFNLFFCSGGTGQTQPSPPPTHPAQRTTGNGRIKQTLKNSKTYFFFP